MEHWTLLLYVAIAAPWVAAIAMAVYIEVLRSKLSDSEARELVRSHESMIHKEAKERAVRAWGRMQVTGWETIALIDSLDMSESESIDKVHSKLLDALRDTAV